MTGRRARATATGETDLLLAPGTDGERSACVGRGSAGEGHGTSDWKAPQQPFGGRGAAIRGLPADPDLGNRADGGLNGGATARAHPGSPVVDGQEDALDAVGNGLTRAVLRVTLALAHLAAGPLPPHARDAVALLEDVPEDIVGLGPDLTRLAIAQGFPASMPPRG